MTEAENGHCDLVQGLSEKMKRLLLVSDDLTPSEKATLGAKITPATSLTGNYLHVAEKLRLEIGTRKWEVSESSKVHLSVHASTLSEQALFWKQDILVNIVFDHLRALRVDLTARAILVREDYSFETHVPGTSEIITGNADCVIGCIPTPALGCDAMFECICAVMMAKENISFYPTVSQAIAHILGMQQRDQRIPKPIYRKSINNFYGIVSDGTCWMFLQLIGKKLQKSDIFDARNSSQRIRIYRFLDAIVKASVDSFPQESFKRDAPKRRKKPKRQVQSKEAVATRAPQRPLREQVQTLFSGAPAHPSLTISYKNDSGKTYQDGYWSGYGNGFDNGHSTGYDHGHHDAYDAYDAGYADGYDNGFDNQDSVHSSDGYEDNEGNYQETQQDLYEQQYEEPYGHCGLEPGESYRPGEAYNGPCDEMNQPYDEPYDERCEPYESYDEPYEDLDEQYCDDRYDQSCVSEGDDYANDYGDDYEDDYEDDYSDYGDDY